MKEVFIWTAFRRVSEQEPFQQRYADYINEIWDSLSQGTQNFLQREAKDMIGYPHRYPLDAVQNWGFILNLKPGANTDKDVQVKMNEEFIFFAVKYAVGRMTYIVSWIVEELEKLWASLQYETKLDIQNYIGLRTEKEGALGADCDQKHWLEVLSWENKVLT
jgi:hypothetical protein